MTVAYYYDLTGALTSDVDGCLVQLCERCAAAAGDEVQRAANGDEDGGCEACDGEPVEAAPVEGAPVEATTWEQITDTWCFRVQPDAYGAGWKASYWNDADPERHWMYETPLFTFPSEAARAARTAIASLAGDEDGGCEACEGEDEEVAFKTPPPPPCPGCHTPNPPTTYNNHAIRCLVCGADMTDAIKSDWRAWHSAAELAELEVA
jgi:hypothetical protein